MRRTLVREPSKLSNLPRQARPASALASVEAIALFFFCNPRIMISRDFRFLLSGVAAGALATGAIFYLRPAPKALFAISSPPSETITSNRPGGLVYLYGAVHKQGVVMIRPGEALTVENAIILDGGLSEFGDSRKVKLLRKMPNGTSQIMLVDLKAQSPLVQPNDLINVPQRAANF
jgi:hypothetical protein